MVPEKTTQLISKVQEHFRMHRELVNIKEIFDEIPYIVWWLRDLEGNMLNCNSHMEQILNVLTPEQVDAFHSICEISDKYTLCSYDTNGLRRPAVFYEVLEIPDCDIKGVWKTTKIARPVDEMDTAKCQIFSLAYRQDMIHGSFENAHNRLLLLEKEKMITKLGEGVYINKARGHY